MGEPLAHMDPGGEGLLADAARRLDRALRSLEAAAARPAGVTAQPVQLVELEIVHQRSRELVAAAAEASQALGRAALEVERALMEDEADASDPQTSMFDAGLLESPLESGPVLPDEEGTEAEESALHREPTA